MTTQPPPRPTGERPTARASDRPSERPASTTPRTDALRASLAAKPLDGQATLGARSLGFYRRAEAALRVGDVAGALLNLRMALAAEPASEFLRDAIADAQEKLKKS